jgi:alpha-tubulin suppressor-like RCC1 family protein
VLGSLSAGDESTCFIGAHLVCFGRNDHGQLGYGDTRDRADVLPSALPAVDLGPHRAWDVYAGDGFACARLADATLKCWGANENGQLGQGSTEPIGIAAGQMGGALRPIELGPNVATAQLGGGFACAVAKAQVGVTCWGLNANGQLGLGDARARGSDSEQMGGERLPRIALGLGRAVLQLAVGTASSCVVLDNSCVKCWGANAAGGLGYGDALDRGAADDSMGAHLPYVRLGKGVYAKAVAVGDGFACALDYSARVKCWGANTAGQLGLEDVLNRGATPGSMGDDLPFVRLDDAAHGAPRRLHARADRTCVETARGQLLCWGANRSGELGLGDTRNRGDAPDTMAANLPPLFTGRAASSVALGASHVCIAFDEGSNVVCRGRNDHGELGYGDTRTRGDEAEHYLGDLSSRSALAAVALSLATAPPAGGVCHHCLSFRCSLWGENKCAAQRHFTDPHGAQRRDCACACCRVHCDEEWRCRTSAELAEPDATSATSATMRRAALDAGATIRGPSLAALAVLAALTLFAAFAAVGTRRATRARPAAELLR